MDKQRVKRDEGIRGSRVVLGRSRRSRLIFPRLPVTLATGALTKKETEKQTLSFIVLWGSAEDNRGSEYSVILIVFAGIPQIPIPPQVVHPLSSARLCARLCLFAPKRVENPELVLQSRFFPKIHPTLWVNYKVLWEKLI